MPGLRVEAEAKPPLPDPFQIASERTGISTKILHILSRVPPSEYKTWPDDWKEKIHDAVTSLHDAVKEWRKRDADQFRVDGDRLDVDLLEKRLREDGKVEAALRLKIEVEARKRDGKGRKDTGTAWNPPPQLRDALVAEEARAKEEKAFLALMADRTKGAEKRLQKYLVENPESFERMKKRFGIERRARPDSEWNAIL